MIWAFITAFAAVAAAFLLGMLFGLWLVYRGRKPGHCALCGTDTHSPPPWMEGR
ncbi:MAG: hypothetical protein ACJ79R_20570 [Anaeromyxobacteraceae bacterium]